MANIDKGIDMNRFVYTIELIDDPKAIEQYIEYHRHVWVEVKNALYSVGVQKMQTFLLGRRLVTIIEADKGFDPQRDLKRYACNEKVKEWDKIMNALQVPVSDAKSDEWWALMELVYDNNWD